MEEQKSPNKACKIIRRSIHTFLTHLHHFSSTPALLALPFSLTLLLLNHPSTAVSTTLHHRITAVILAGIPVNSPIFNFFIIKLSQTLSVSISSLPISLTFLLLSKSSTIQSLKSLDRFTEPSSFTFFPLLLTQICNLFLLIAANSACFTIIFLFSTLIGTLPTWLSIAGAIFYSIIIAHTIIVCNLALISSGYEGKGGVTAILRAIVLIKRNTITALALALPANLAMAAAEVVFRCRIYGVGGEERWVWGIALEMALIGYVYSFLIVGDTIVGCLFYESCKEELGLCEDDDEIEEQYPSDLVKLRALEEGFSC